MLRRKFIETALSGLTAFGLAAVTKPPAEVEVPILNIEMDTDYLGPYIDDSILSLKSKDVGGPSELSETDTYATFVKQGAEDNLFNAASEPVFIIDSDGILHLHPSEVQ